MIKETKEQTNRQTNKRTNNKHILHIAHIARTTKCRNIYIAIYVWTSKLINNNRK